MTWTPAQWEAFCGLMEEAWPGEFDDTAARSYRLLLDGIEPERVVGALRSLLVGGQRFRPSVSELLAAVRHDPSRPTFDEALTLIFDPRHGVMSARPPKRGVWKENAWKVARDAARTHRLDEVHPLVASFINRVTFGRLDHIDLGNEWHRKELREAWDRHVDTTDGREVAVLARGTGRDGMRQLDPLSALGLDRPAAAGELTSGATEAEAA